MAEESKDYEEMSTYKLTQMAEEQGVEDPYMLSRDELISALRGRSGAQT